MENRWANDIDGSALEAHLDKSQGRPMKSPGSKPIAQKRPAQPVLPKAPVPVTQTLRPEPSDSNLKDDFHAPKGSTSGQVAWPTSEEQVVCPS